MHKIAEAIGKIAEVVKVYYLTRQDAYNRKMDRRLRKAIEHAERGFLAIDIDTIDTFGIPEGYEDDWKDMRKAFLKAKRYFFKYN